MDLIEEKQLIECAKDDPLAFGKLYDAYYPKISNYLLHRLQRSDVAADITSEVFFKGMTKLHTFSWRNISFLSWLYKIANNEIKMYYRKKERKFFSLEFLFEHSYFEIPDTTNIEEEYIAVEEELSRNVQFRDIQKQLIKLPLLYQEILVLRYFEEKNLNEISEITGKNLNTIKSLLSRGKDKLRKKMEEENENSK
ncbi:MAG TPA: RNA polymerase sigma factor [Candidatus Sulfotelmatobacter sp.]|jgi:RNA polymerase sigma-70 factor (ECF subfamily)|nr:RNA polymerase sigma factor [Candidatus Sulfotelmatobacter sp.]